MKGCSDGSAHRVGREDMYAQDSIDMLTGAGIQFKRHEEDGVEVDVFAELLITSGLVLNEEVTWTTFARSVEQSACHAVLECPSH